MGESGTSCIGRGLLPLGLRAYPPHVLLKQLIISVFFKIKKTVSLSPLNGESSKFITNFYLNLLTIQ